MHVDDTDTLSSCRGAREAWEMREESIEPDGKNERNQQESKRTQDPAQYLSFWSNAGVGSGVRQMWGRSCVRYTYALERRTQTFASVNAPMFGVKGKRLSVNQRARGGMA